MSKLTKHQKVLKRFLRYADYMRDIESRRYHDNLYNGWPAPAKHTRDYGRKHGRC